MQKKVLFCATVDYHFKAFHLPYLKWFKEHGWEVHIAANGDLKLPYVDKKFNIPIQRSPFDKLNINALRELKEIINLNNYKIIHCHTPMGGVLARLAAKEARKRGTNVIYTAHGFHFCKGAPILNWALYYPIEKWLSNYTDCLLTINEEDYQLALNRRFKANRIEHVHGVGVDTQKFYPPELSNKYVLRKEVGYSKEDFLLFYAAEFNKNKNQQFLIRSFALIKKELPNARLLLAGDGELLEECRRLANDLGVKEMVHFLGYRNDIEALLKISDAAVASSLREGLPVNIMEAMSCGLPVIASENRGHRELIQNEHSGWLISPNDVEAMAEKIKRLALRPDLIKKLGENARVTIEEKYSINKVLIEKRNIYTLLMGDKEEWKWAVH